MALDIKKVKAVLQIEDTSYDNFMKILIPMMEAEIRSECRYEADEAFPESLQFIGAHMIGFHMNVRPGVTSESVGDTSENYTEDYPEYIKKGLRLHRKAKFI